MLYSIIGVHSTSSNSGRLMALENKMRRGFRVCICPNCGNDESNTRLSFFSFPSDTERREVWCRNLCIDSARTNMMKARICADHFDKKHFCNERKMRLKQTAVPFQMNVIPVGGSLTPVSISQVQSPLRQPLKLQSTKSSNSTKSTKCLVPAMKSISTREVERAPTNHILEEIKLEEEVDPLEIENVMGIEEEAMSMDTEAGTSGTDVDPILLEAPPLELAKSQSTCQAPKKSVPVSNISGQQILTQVGCGNDMQVPLNILQSLNPTSIIQEQSNTIAPEPSSNIQNQNLCNVANFTQPQQQPQWIIIQNNGVPCLVQLPQVLPQNNPLTLQQQHGGGFSAVLPEQTLQSNINFSSFNPTLASPITSSMVNSYGILNTGNAADSECDFTLGRCMVCSSTIKSRGINSYMRKTKESLATVRSLLKILNLNLSSDLDFDFGGLPFCLNCFGKVFELVTLYEQLLYTHRQFESLKSEVMKGIVASFCREKAMEENVPYHQSFYNSPDLQHQLADTLKSRKPTQRTFVVTTSTNEQTFDEDGEDLANTANIPESHETEFDFDMDWDMEPGKESNNSSQSESEEEPEAEELTDPTGNEFIVEGGVKFEICVEGKNAKKTVNRKWEALARCEQTRDGLEKLIPLSLRRVICPICKKKIFVNKVTAHISRHTPKQRKKAEGFQARITLMSQQILTGNARFKLLKEKLKLLSKSNRNGEEDTVVPFAYRTVKCPICEISVSQKCLSSHLNRHTGDKPFKCLECGRGFARYSNLFVHSKQHVDKLKTVQSYFCDFCETEGSLFKSKVTYASHCLTDHSDQIKMEEPIFFYDCDAVDCDQSFSNYDHFIQHLGSHSVHACETPGCSKIFAALGNYENHKSRVHNVEETGASHQQPLFECKFCPIIFVCERTFKLHEITHGVDFRADANEHPHLCDECGKAFKDRIGLYQHKRHVHMKKSVQRVKESTTANQSRPRIPRASNTTEKTPMTNTRCKVCLKMCTYLPRHMLDVHTYVNGLECYICNQKFSKLFYLEPHIRRHLGQPRVSAMTKCKYCGDEFTNEIPMRKHCCLTHPEEYLALLPYYCQICWFRLGTEEELTNHHLKFHEQWKCTICGRQNYNRFRFDCHMRIHTGEKPYVCQICNKGFTIETNLREHMARHEGRKLFSCQICPGVGFMRRKMLRQHMEKCHNDVGGALDEETRKFLEN